MTAIGISANDKYIVATDAAEKVGAYVFDIKGGADPIADASINAVVTHVNCHPKDENVFACCGAKHMTLCNIKGDKVEMKKGKKCDNVNMCAVAFSANESNTLYAGGADGNVWHFTGDSATKSYQNNKGSVHTVALKHDGQSEVLLVGGSDKTLTSYKIGSGGGLTKTWTIPVDSPPRSVDL